MGCVGNCECGFILGNLREWARWRKSWANTMFSIREFCELQTPIFMFDKDGAFVVMILEQVWLSNPYISNGC